MQGKKTAEISQFRPNFHNFGGSCAHPILPTQAKFGKRQLIHCIRLHTKFQLNPFTVSPSTVKKTTMMGKFWHLEGSFTHPFHWRGPNLVCQSKPIDCAYVPNFVSIGLFCLSLVAKNPIFYCFTDFGISWCCQMAMMWESLTQVHNYKPSPIQPFENCFCIPTI